MDFLQECDELLGSKNLYEILGVNKDATSKEIKSAYRKKSLKVHPDRATGEEQKENAKRAFQALTKVHFILTDDELRAYYDETGSVASEDTFSSFNSFEEYENYWRTLFPKVTTTQLDDFFAKYIGSAEEEEDLKNLYLKHDGNLDIIYEYHIGYDEDRVCNMLHSLIDSNQLPALPAFVKEPKSNKQKRFNRITKEKTLAQKAEKKHKENKDKDNMGNLSDLALAIRKKNANSFDDMVAQMEAKYGNKKSNKKRRN